MKEDAIYFVEFIDEVFAVFWIGYVGGLVNPLCESIDEFLLTDHLVTIFVEIFHHILCYQIMIQLKFSESNILDHFFQLRLRYKFVVIRIKLLKDTAKANKCISEDKSAIKKNRGNKRGWTNLFMRSTLGLPSSVRRPPASKAWLWTCFRIRDIRRSILTSSCLLSSIHGCTTCMEFSKKGS